jgi:hypothetical protein
MQQNATDLQVLQQKNFYATMRSPINDGSTADEVKVRLFMK